MARDGSWLRGALGLQIQGSYSCHYHHRHRLLFPFLPFLLSLYYGRRMRIPVHFFRIIPPGKGSTNWVKCITRFLLWGDLGEDGIFVYRKSYSGGQAQAARKWVHANWFPNGCVVFTCFGVCV
ncbi:hypothetical protein F4814DRAFT_157593 [Daldinia grandis]|nr:hypothetical protein F4814DRAFT_157593 [Daldinia grandis]